MKQVFFLVLAIIIITPSFSQDTLSGKSKKIVAPWTSYISVSYGASIPIGSFSRGQGYALLGHNYFIDAGTLFNKNAGLCFKAGTFKNSLDVSRMAHDFAFNPSDPNTSYGINTQEKWRSNFYFVGPYLSFPSKNLTVDLKFLGGFITTAYPNVDVTSTNGTYVKQYKTVSVPRDYFFAYNMGLTVKMKLEKRLYINFDASMIYSKPNYSYQIVNYYAKNTPTDATQSKNFYQDVMMINTSWGLSFFFK